MIVEELRGLLAIVLRFPSFGLCCCGMCVVLLEAVTNGSAQESVQIQFYREGDTTLLSGHCGGFLLASLRHLVCNCCYW